MQHQSHSYYDHQPHYKPWSHLAAALYIQHLHKCTYYTKVCAPRNSVSNRVRLKWFFRHTTYMDLALMINGQSVANDNTFACLLTLNYPPIWPHPPIIHIAHHAPYYLVPNTVHHITTYMDHECISRSVYAFDICTQMYTSCAFKSHNSAYKALGYKIDFL